MTIRRCKLTEIAQVERGMPGKIYPAGTVYIQVSASNGQVGMTKTPQAIEAKYAAITPQINLIPAYFKIAVERAVPEFMAKYKTTINIQMDAFQHFDIDIHEDAKEQAFVAEIIGKTDELIQMVEQTIDVEKTLKRIYLSKLIV